MTWIIRIIMEEDVHSTHCNSCFSNTCTSPACPTTACPNHCGVRWDIFAKVHLQCQSLKYRLHSCKLPDHLSEICPLQQVTLFAQLTLERICGNANILLDFPGFLHQLLLWLPSTPSETVQSQPSGGRWLIIVLERKPKKDSSLWNIQHCPASLVVCCQSWNRCGGALG